MSMIMFKQKNWKYFIYILMIGYVVLVAANMYQIDGLVEKSEDYAVTISKEARELRIRCSELEATLPGLYSSPHLSYDEVKSELLRQEESRLNAYERLNKSFDGTPEVMRSLAGELHKLSELINDGSTKLDGNLSYELAATYVQHSILPQLKVINNLLNEFTLQFTTHLDGMQAHIHTRIHLVIISSILSGIIIIIATMLYDRREAQSRTELAYRDGLFKQLADSIDEVFIIAADQNYFEYVSTNTRRILGRNARVISEDPTKLYELLPEEDAAWLIGYLKGDNSPEAFERDIFLPERDMYLKIRVYSICVASIREERVIIVITDETDAVKQQHALSDSLEVAHAASAAKSSFLSHMSHEIRTPMNAIIGMTTIALSRITDRARVKDCLEKVSESSRHLMRLINDVLDMSKIEAGKLALSHEPFNLHGVIENLHNFITPQTESRKQHFEIIVEDIEEENLLGDAMRLNQILLNILSNAIKFTPENGRIIFRLSQIMPNSTQSILRFLVSDTGIGMSQEFLDRLYEPFEQATPNTASRYGGTGLGMPITANLIAMMGGSINVKSQLGQGTTFSIEIPFDLGAKQEQGDPSLPPLQILLIEGDEESRGHLKSALNKMGHSVTSVSAGKEALAELQKREVGEFDICMVDCDQATASQDNLCAEIRRLSSGPIQILGMSSHEGLIGEDIRINGLDGVLSRPIFPSTLQTGLAEAIARRDSLTNDPTPEIAKLDFTGKRVLLVEDNEFNREIGQEFLEMVNVVVEHAENGKEAIEKMLSEPAHYYDLILMDVQMPIMDGYEATRAIRDSSHPDALQIPILAMTANAFSEDVAKALNAGMNGHIAKPIDINALYTTLQKYLGIESHPAVQAGSAPTPDASQESKKGI